MVLGPYTPIPAAAYSATCTTSAFEKAFFAGRAEETTAKGLCCYIHEVCPEKVKNLQTGSCGFLQRP